MNKMLLCAAALATGALVPGGTLSAQLPCDPAVAPANLQVLDTDPAGLTLRWDATPGSVAARLRVTLPSGATVGKTIVGPEPMAFFVPAERLETGIYVWQVQAGCSVVPPYDLTPFSLPNTYVYGVPSTCPDSVLDVDGNVYGVTGINGQCWTTSHLATTRYRNGDSIPYLGNAVAWGGTTQGARVAHSNLPALAEELGYLYNWYAVDDVRGLCPVGWHVPSRTEMDDMIASLGASPAVQLRATGNIVLGTGPWAAPNSGTNSSGFNGQPGGYRDNLSGNFFLLRQSGYYWSSTSTSPANARHFRLENDEITVSDFSNNKATGRSVRCVQD